jgi:ribonuclease PH
MRSDGRQPDEHRPVKIIPEFVKYPEGSVLIQMGDTWVLCSATVEDSLPRWMQIQGKTGGWITAEYAMLPRSTSTRMNREREPSGRTQEIRRLIGRSLRAAVDLEKIGARSILIDCDVLQADGGTRTASITGGYLALAMALSKLARQGKIPADALLPPVAAISVGILKGSALLDLDYSEDSQAEVDLNVVMNANGDFIEVQGTAEGAAFPRRDLDTMLNLAAAGIQSLFSIQQSVFDHLNLS